MTDVADGALIGARFLDDDVVQAAVDALFEAMPGTDTSIHSRDIRKAWCPWMTEVLAAVWLKATREPLLPRPDEKRMRDVAAQMVAVRAERDDLERRLRELETQLSDVHAEQSQDVSRELSDLSQRVVHEQGLNKDLRQQVFALEVGVEATEKELLAEIGRLKKALAQERAEHQETARALEQRVAA